MWSKWVTLTTQLIQMGKPIFPGILKEIVDWREAINFESLPEKVTHTEEAPPCNELADNKRGYALFTDGSCHIVGNYQRWKASSWSPT